VEFFVAELFEVLDKWGEHIGHGLGDTTLSEVRAAIKTLDRTRLDARRIRHGVGSKTEMVDPCAL